MSRLYRWEGNYKLPSGREVLLEIGYSWGDPDTGIGAGIEKIEAFNDSGDPVELAEHELEHITADAGLCERIEDRAAAEVEAYMEARR